MFDPYATLSLKVDKKASMGLISDVKQALLEVSPKSNLYDKGS